MSMTTAPSPDGFPVETDLGGFFLAAFLRLLLVLICLILPPFLPERVIEIQRHVQELTSPDSGVDVDGGDSLPLFFLQLFILLLQFRISLKTTISSFYPT